ncbi:glycoside hydrolase superfamily [Mucidula mucida]|nr:glycoside hydrolase superfamily [Mucidula mucida]
MLVPFISCLLLSRAWAASPDVPSRATNEDGSTPLYKDPTASIEDRVNDLLPRMTLEEKVAQLIQGDISGWIVNAVQPNRVEEMMRLKGGAIWAGYAMPWKKYAFAIEVGQRYLMENTTLGIPALFQSEGLHGFTNNGTIFPSPLGLAATFNTSLIEAVGAAISNEAEPFGITHIFAPVLDMSRELRWGRVEENYGEDPFLTGAMGLAYVSGIQNGAAAMTEPAPVAGGERELRTIYLPPFEKACLESLTIMTSYASYDGVPAIADTHIMVDILREEWGYPYYVTSDAGSVDLLITEHQTCETRECAAKTNLENALSGEMGGGTYTYLTLVVDEAILDRVVATMLRTKFTLGLFESPYPYEDVTSQIRTPETIEVLHNTELESIVLLENRDGILPLSTDTNVALIGPLVDYVSFGDYVFFNSNLNAISPLEGFSQFLGGSDNINYAEGCKLWSNDESGFQDAVDAAGASDVAIVFVGTWSLDQTRLWSGVNATTGEHVDVADLALVGAQLNLVKAVKETGKPTIVVLVSGKPVAEPWIQAHADAVLQQFYPGELGGLAIAEIILALPILQVRKLPISFPRDVGTAPSFYNYLKGARPNPIDAGDILDDGTLVFGHGYVLNSPVPLWSFGHGLSYTTFNYTDLTLSSSTIGASDDFEVTVTVHNTGNVDGKEVVQVYITDIVSSIVTPNQQLVGFSKVYVPAGASEIVTIPVLSSQLAVWTNSGGWAVEPGRFNVKIGTSEESFVQTNLTVSG